MVPQSQLDKWLHAFFYKKVFYKKVLLAPVKNTPKIKKVLLEGHDSIRKFLRKSLLSYTLKLGKIINMIFNTPRFVFFAPYIFHVWI